MGSAANQIVMTRCQFQRLDGAPCGANSRRGSAYCFFHDPAVAEQRALARKAGGIARNRKVMPRLQLPDRRLTTAADVVEVLAETVNLVRRGEIDLRTSNAIGYLSGILLSAIEKTSYEDRLLALEKIVSLPRCPDDPLAENAKFEFVEVLTGPGSSD